MRISDWSSDVCSSDLHFDPADIARQQMTEIISVADAARIVDLHPVDQHQSLRRLGAAQGDAGYRSGAARPVEPHAGRGGEQVDNVDRLAPLDRVGLDDGDRLADLVARLFDARLSHYYLVAALVVGGLR